MRHVRLGLAQVNTTVGDLGGNSEIIRDYLQRGRQAGCDIVAFPELAITGYPPEDLLLRRSFCEASRDALHALAPATAGIIAVVGFVDWHESDAWNAAAVFADGQLVDVYHKQRLPNYGVFDEERYFATGTRTVVFDAGSFIFGVSICEDIWYAGEPLDTIALAGAQLVVNINASPYHQQRIQGRARMLATRAADNLIAVAYVNQVGGQDELVFDGGTLVFDAQGDLLARGPQFVEDLVVCDVDVDQVEQRRLHDTRRRIELRGRDGWHGAERVAVTTIDGSDWPLTPKTPITAPKVDPMEPEEEVWNALVVATRDYMNKIGFKTALVSLSGGIDSSIVVAIAVEAIGAENVIGVSLPSRYSSEHSKDDARILAERLGIRYLSIPIEPAHAAMLEMLAEAFEGTEPGTAEENLQSRQRGNVMMSLSNKFERSILLTCGNKSEMATGYATLYGDMAGGYAVIKDVPKLWVYRVCRWYNNREGTDVIPEHVLTKPPSAELRPNQVDQDSLPPYEILDPILEAYVEDDRTLDEIVAMGFEPEVVRRVMGMVDRNEYKRRQAAPGVKITPRAFGRDRRFPLASRWRGV